MPILDIQRRLQEVGRIRLGQQVKTSGGKTRPAKLDRFRLTSANRTAIEAAAQLYGGIPQPWEAPAGKQWELFTETDRMNVIVPPGDMTFSTWYELWSAGGCQRRCDGVTETISDSACPCNPDNRECNVHTRLSVMLRDVPGLGLWRVETQGWYALNELSAAVDIIGMVAGRGQMLPAVLRLDQRMVKRGGQTRRFAVPVLDLDVSPAQLLSGRAAIDPGTVAIEPPRQALTDGAARIDEQPALQGGNLSPVPDKVTERPVGSIADQVNAEVKSRRRSTTPTMPQTGVAPRNAEQAAAGRSAEQVAAATAPPVIDAQIEDDVPPPPPEPTEDPWGSAPPAQQRSQSEQSAPPANTAPADNTSSGTVSKPTTAMNRKAHACFRELGVNDRAERLIITSVIVGRKLASSAEMTFDDGKTLIDTLEKWLQGHGFDFGIASAADQIAEILNAAALADEAAAQ